MTIHGIGMFTTLRVSDALKEHYVRLESLAIGLGIVVLASWMIILTDLVEVGVWSGFSRVQSAHPSASTAFYDSLLNYTTLQAGYLPKRWHLLEGLLGMAGLLTLAWSTGTLYALVEAFQQGQPRIRKQKRQRHRAPHSQGDATRSGDRP
jgi:hypothetical protein